MKLSHLNSGFWEAVYLATECVIVWMALIINFQALNFSIKKVLSLEMV